MQKYFTPVLQFLILVGGALQAAVVDDVFTPTEAWQLLALTVGAVATFFAPLVSGPWPSVLKTGSAVVAGVVAALIPVLEGSGWSTSAIIVIALAALNALASEVGTFARIDAAAAIIANPNVDNRVALEVDPTAYRLAASAPLR